MGQFAAQLGRIYATDIKPAQAVTDSQMDSRLSEAPASAAFGMTVDFF